jgi:hypothetical protein
VGMDASQTKRSGGGPGHWVEIGMAIGAITQCRPHSPGQTHALSPELRMKPHRWCSSWKVADTPCLVLRARILLVALDAAAAGLGQPIEPQLIPVVERPIDPLVPVQPGDREHHLERSRVVLALAGKNHLCVSTLCLPFQPPGTFPPGGALAGTGRAGVHMLAGQGRAQRTHGCPGTRWMPGKPGWKRTQDSGVRAAMDGERGAVQREASWSGMGTSRPCVPWHCQAGRHGCKWMFATTRCGFLYVPRMKLMLASVYVGALADGGCPGKRGCRCVHNVDSTWTRCANVARAVPGGTHKCTFASRGCTSESLRLRPSTGRLKGEIM